MNMPYSSTKKGYQELRYERWKLFRNECVCMHKKKCDIRTFQTVFGSIEIHGCSKEIKTMETCPLWYAANWNK